MVLALLALTVLPAGADAGVGGDTALVSLNNSDVKQDGSFVDTPAVSGDGRYVAFAGNAPNFGATVEDVYVRDTVAGTTTLVSRATGAAGAEGNGPSDAPSISADGRYIAFESTATNLVPTQDNSGDYDIYVRDMLTDTTTLVSRSDGTGDDVGASANAVAESPSISADGQKIAFESAATNLDGATGGNRQIFVRDMGSDDTTLVSRSSSGSVADVDAEAPSISADGSAVAFDSFAGNLDAADADGGADSVFVRDLGPGTTSLVSRATGANGVNADGASFGPSISGDGDRIAFVSAAGNLDSRDSDATRDVFVRDRSAATTELVDVTADNNLPGDGINDGHAVISASGRFVAFESFSTNLPDDSDGNIDIAARDLQTDTTFLVSRADGANGANSNGSDHRPAISADGSVIAFYSEATNLDAGDSDVTSDVYTRTLDIDLTAPTIEIDSGPSGRTADTTPTFTFGSMDDDVASVACAVDGSPVPCSSSTSHTTTPLADGPHTFAVTATDTSNNVSAPASRSFTVDATGPPTKINSKPPAMSTDTTPTVTFSSSAADLASFACRVDGGAFSACSSPFTTPALAPGAHTIDVRATDDLGNNGPAQHVAVTVVAPDHKVDSPLAKVAKTIKAKGSELAVPVAAGAGETVKVVVTGAVETKPRKGRAKSTALAQASGGAATGKTAKLVLGYPGSTKKRQKLTKRLTKTLQGGGKGSVSLAVKLTDGTGNSVTLDRSAKLKAPKAKKRR